MIDRPDEARRESDRGEDQGENDSRHCGQAQHAPPLADENLPVQEAPERRVGGVWGSSIAVLSARPATKRRGGRGLDGHAPVGASLVLPIATAQTDDVPAALLEAGFGARFASAERAAPHL